MTKKAKRLQRNRLQFQRRRQKHELRAATTVTNGSGAHGHRMQSTIMVRMLLPLLLVVQSVVSVRVVVLSLAFAAGLAMFGSANGKYSEHVVRTIQVTDDIGGAYEHLAVLRAACQHRPGTANFGHRQALAVSNPRASIRARRRKASDPTKDPLWREAQEKIDAVVLEYHGKISLANAKGRGAIYARYSTRRGQRSIPDQVRELLAVALREDIYVDRQHVFFDVGIRGYRDSRPGLDSLRAALATKPKPFEHLYVFSTSRLFRKNYKAVRFVEEEVVERGVRCLFLSNNIDTANEKQWRLTLQICSAVDECGTGAYADNIRASHIGLHDGRHKCGTLPLGYRGEPIAGQFTKRGRPRELVVIDADGFGWVKRIFTWFTEELLSMREIVRRLNADPAAPKPPKSTSGRWTDRTVRYVLTNRRYIGKWCYGERETIYISSKDSIVQKPRQEALRQSTFEELRIVSDATFDAAQLRLTTLKETYGRRPGHSTKNEPTPLNLMFVCPASEHGPLYIGGSDAKYFFCQKCGYLPMDQRAIYSQLPVGLATQRVLTVLAQLVQAGDELTAPIILSCQRAAAAAQQPDPDRLAWLRSQVQNLARVIDFNRRNPGETSDEAAATKKLIKELSVERATVAQELATMERSRLAGMRIPSTEEVRAFIGKLYEVLIKAATSSGSARSDSVRRITTLLTGDQIVVEQMGERAPRRGWLRGKFRLQLLNAVAEHFAGCSIESDADGPEVVIDFKAPEQSDERVARAFELHQRGKSNKEIERELGLWRSQVTQFLKRGFAAHGLEKPDGRKQKRMSKPPLYQRIADDVARLLDKGLLIEEIAAELKCCMATVKNAADHLRAARGLAIPDGRTRRKTLERKSRRQDDHGDAA